MSKSFKQDDDYFNLKKRKFRERRTQKLKKPKNGKTAEEKCPPTEFATEEPTK
jgi:hypothetical protein